MDTFELLNSVASSFPNTYQSVKWLGTPSSHFDGLTPAQMIESGEIEQVYSALQIEKKLD